MNRRQKSHPYGFLPGNSHGWRSSPSNGAFYNSTDYPNFMSSQQLSINPSRESFKAPTLKGRRLPPPAPLNSLYDENRYKTELCRQFDELGYCEYGSRCLFAHGKQELKSLPNRHPKFKTERCSSYHEFGFCSFGPRCSFIHEKPDPAEIIRKLASVIPPSSRGGGDGDVQAVTSNLAEKENSPSSATEHKRLPVFTRICP